MLQQRAPAQLIEEEIKSFVRTSPTGRMPFIGDFNMFDEPLVRFASANDPLFAEYKKVIAPTHLTPHEALSQAYGKNIVDMPKHLSVVSWILPIAEETRQSNRSQTKIPTRLWSETRWYGEKSNEALRAHMVETIKEMGYLAVAPAIQPYFKISVNERGKHSNWSERHIAYVAGHGTFSLSDGFISERGIAIRCGSLVTNMELPASPRTAQGPYENCLFYAGVNCRACIDRCPVGAVTEKGHDKIRCDTYLNKELSYLLKEYNVGVGGCGLCQTKVPCEFSNPAKKIKQK
ncbi:MAG: epoxyqueuosine reductase [Chloroflexi bacterium]|nr:epoxyqueuosine reductase [Chloroflexota bacterium]